MAGNLGKEKFVWLLDAVGKEVLQYLLYSKIFETILREINIKELLISSDVGKLYGVDRDYHWENLEFLQVPTLKLIIENAERDIAVTKQDNVTSLCRLINKNVIPKKMQYLIQDKVAYLHSKGKTLKGISNVYLKKLSYGENVDLETLDIWTLCSLIRSLFNTHSSKKSLETNDMSEGGDVYRLLDYRNKLAHGIPFDISAAWDEIPRVILRLGRGRTIFRDKIEEIKNRRSTDQRKKDFESTLADWKTADQQISADFKMFKKSQREELRTHASDIKEEIQSSARNIENAITEGQRKTEQALNNVMENYESKIKRHLATDKWAIPKLLQEMKREIHDNASSKFMEMKTQIDKFVNNSPVEMDVQREVLAKTSDIKRSVNDLGTELASKEELNAMSKTSRNILETVVKVESQMVRLSTDLEKVSSSSPLCCWWDVDNTESLKIIKSSSQEYQNVVDELKKAEIPHNIVLRVARIQNTALYQQYEAKKSQMLKKNPPGFRSERFLWHRPKYSRIEEINANGFSEINCGERNDIAYGNGIPFLVKPMQYAFTENKDTHDNQTIYLCSVLTGDFTKGTSQLRLPPKKPDSEAGVCYDSVVDDPKDPNVFVIFHGIQAYPHYLLTFK